ncbi:ATPase inhibitor subunit zeta [Peteryoungia ipomoeae]|uniref:DUF1476 family protein n=1 Tax=Peteryoungia ipomoeae TaxID=1210932 RepID=A0A4S8NZX9_9HYPH|nr:ATPase inhibitor subunit zeta [Peteryoungia ipomoeae]THV23327.1 DUF1476 family protein [Peteryoungia ipomoeae]
MNPLKKRAQAHEVQFARQAEQQFKTQALCGTMLGRWAGYQMGVDDVESYARNIAMRQVVEPHRLFDLIKQDFSASKVAVSDDEISARLHDFMERARDRVFREG